MPNHILLTLLGGRKVRPHFIRITPNRWRALIEPNGHLFGEGETRREATRLLQERVDEFYREIERVKESS